MKLKKTGVLGSERYILKSKKQFSANRGLLGITLDGKEILIAQGYDAGVREDFTLAERQEIAAYMIKLWKRWVNFKPPAEGWG